MYRFTTFFLALGIGLLVLGAIQLLPALLHSPDALRGLGVGICLGSGILLCRAVRRWGQEKRVQRNLVGVSPEAAERIQMLYGNYTPFVVEAAEHLGEARETTSVPALMHVLEQTVNTQPPGWCDTAEAMVAALGKMGDRRALPLLNRLTNVRGIGFLTAVHDAIDRIEPQTSLLRPGSADGLPPETLLRPANYGPESDPASLLRADNSQS